MIKKRFIFEFRLTCQSGLHLGNEEGQVSPRGLDSPVLQHPTFQKNGEFSPFISATSIKGKLRNIAEMLFVYQMNKTFHKIEVEDKPIIQLKRHECLSIAEASECPVCSLFGTGAEGLEGRFYSRLIFRNARLDRENVPDDFKSEIKMENTIDRMMGEANPRIIERVPAQINFWLKVNYLVPAGEEAKVPENFNRFIACLRFLEDYYVGGNGSRGSGEIKISGIKFKSLTYKNLIEFQKEIIKILAEEVQQ